ncbi:MAG TPA: hypothetical protein VK550_31735 [Polyangiaceae bacterium]|nr:hypothetical protein [Polyangiaceae bacterium]
MFERLRDFAGDVVLFVIVVVVVGCSDASPSATTPGPGNGSSDDAGAGRDDAATPPGDGACSASFDSTYAAIQTVIFQKRGCTQDACHGSQAQGQLDLRPEVAYQNLIDVPAVGSSMKRVDPGLPSRSYLYQKLQAALYPERSEISGSPMPNGGSLTSDELTAMHLWIEGGAPKDGSVLDDGHHGGQSLSGLLNACLPPGAPVTIKPLDPPAAEQGIQFEMPPYPLAARTEKEVCFAGYYDFTDRVPARFKDDQKGVFFANGLQMRQDPQSHHLVIMHTGLGPDYVHDPSFGTWRCQGGARQGDECEPTDIAFCGEGMCASESKASTACIGYGPKEAAVDASGGGIGAAMAPQTYFPPRDGVYRQIPLRGILYYNSHAFNLTGEDHQMHGRLNVLYTSDLRNEEVFVAVSAHVFAATGIAPFTKSPVCADYVVPLGASMIRLTSHTHKRGERFWVTLPNGDEIYESLVYSDPLYKQFEPGMLFDSADATQRTLHYCATYNNGVRADGTPDVNVVTRASTMPAQTSCSPIACVRGKTAQPCAGASDNASCDSSPGAGDGWCDACAIASGVTSENEMFIVIPNLVLPPK